MQLKFLMVQLTYLNLNGEKRLSYILLYDLYGQIYLTTKSSKYFAKLRMTAQSLTKNVAIE